MSDHQEHDLKQIDCLRPLVMYECQKCHNRFWSTRCTEYVDCLDATTEEDDR